MEFAVDITGDVSGATKGEAALRAEATAGRAAETSVAGVAKAMGNVGGAVKGVQAGAAAVRDLGKAAKGAMSDLDALSKATEKRQGSRASRSAAALMGKAGVPATAMPKLGPGLAAPHEDSNTSSPWAKAAGSSTPAVKGAAPAGGGGGGGAASAFTGIASAVKGASVALVAYGAAMAGVNSLSDLTRMAIGWRTMGQLQLISWRATMDLRRAVAGVDAQPVVRAATQLERNLSKSTVTGSALSGILTRGYTSFFQGIEKIEPVLSRAFQVGVLGALELEDAWLRLRIALFPVTSVLEDATKDIDLLGIAAEGAGAPFKLISAYVDTMAAGIRTAVDLAERLNKALGGGIPGKMLAVGKAIEGSEVGKSILHPLDQLRETAHSYASGHETDEARATRRALGDNSEDSNATQMADSIAGAIITTLDARTPEIKAAGGRAGKAAIDGAREATDTHSPSREAIKFAGDIVAGEVIGLDRGAGAIQDAADRSMAPTFPGGTGGGGGVPGGSAGGITIQNLQVGPFEVHGGGDDLEARLLAMAPRLAQEILRILSMRAGLAGPGT